MNESKIYDRLQSSHGALFKIYAVFKRVLLGLEMISEERQGRERANQFMDILNVLYGSL